jgi:cell division protein ZapD
VILYEYPFNERLRTYLRLEQLFRRLGELIPRQHPLDHHFALVTIFEIMDVAARADLKSDVLKDIEKHKHQLDSYRGNPSISEAALDAVVAQLDHCFTALNQQTGKSGHALTENDWLMSIRSRMGIPGGTCGFDLPAYYAWQHAALHAAVTAATRLTIRIDHFARNAASKWTLVPGLPKSSGSRYSRPPTSTPTSPL